MTNYQDQDRHQTGLQQGERGGLQHHGHHLPPLLPHHRPHPQPLQADGGQT